jgi:rSAM/selenodomain-associated transferase 2
MQSAVKASISIIIPVYREQDNINACLSHLGSLRAIEHCEVILVDGDGGSTLKAVAPSSYPFRLLKIVSRQGRGHQLDVAARKASGRLLVFLHVDTLLPRGALGMIEKTLRSYDAGAFSLGMIEAKPLFKTWLAYTNAVKRLLFNPYGDQAIFMKSDIYRKVGGFPALPIMEDAALIRRLKRGSYRVKLLHTRILTSDRRWKKRGYILNFIRNTALYMFYRMGVSPHRLAGYYKPNYDNISKIS